MTTVFKFLIRLTNFDQKWPFTCSRLYFILALAIGCHLGVMWTSKTTKLWNTNLVYPFVQSYIFRTVFYSVLCACFR